MELKNYENIVADVKACLDMHKWPYSDAGVRATVDRWLEAKGGVIDILRKHPNWNEDAMAVVFDYDTMRDIDLSKYYEAAQRLQGSIPMVYDDARRFERVTNYHKVGHQFVTEEMSEHFKLFDITAAVGTKVSRVLGRYFRSIGLDKAETYNHDYAELSDALNPLKIKRFSLLSVHPCDYLHMSYGTGWESCHNIDDGCYMTGTLSYMGDACSMIFFTVDKSYSGESRFFWKQEKINRQVYAYHDNLLLQSRLYPNCNDMDNYTNFRNAVQKIMADAVGVPNYWTITSTWDNLYANGVRTCDEGRHYPDYTYDEYHANLSMLKDAPHGELWIGSQAYCVDCGKAISDDSILNCCGRYRCKDCGKYISYGREVEINDAYYCHECVERCAECGEFHLKSAKELYVVYSERHGEQRVCSNCRDGYCTLCAVCGKYFRKDNGMSIRQYGNETICTSCANVIVVAHRKGDAHETA